MCLRFFSFRFLLYTDRSSIIMMKTLFPLLFRFSLALSLFVKILLKLDLIKQKRVVETRKLTTRVFFFLFHIFPCTLIFFSPSFLCLYLVSLYIRVHVRFQFE